MRAQLLIVSQTSYRLFPFKKKQSSSAYHRAGVGQHALDEKWLRSLNNNLWQHYASVNDDKDSSDYNNFVSSVDAGGNNQHRWR